jgi:hypothetical protein
MIGNYQFESKNEINIVLPCSMFDSFRMQYG